jgi:hypothetical protein
MLKIICAFALVIFAPIFTSAAETPKKILIFSANDPHLPAVAIVDKATRGRMLHGFLR